jgi:hypothetical protein
MAEDRDDDAPDYQGLDRIDASLYRQGDEEGRIFDDGRTLTSVEDATAEDGRPKSLMDLQDGINGATAQQMILEQVYQMAVLCNFIGVRLNASSGAKHPRLFSESTRAL